MIRTLLMSCLILVSCIPLPEESLNDPKACTLVGFFDTSQIDIHLKDTLSENYQIQLDSETLNKGCFGSYPCFSETNRLNNTLKIEVYFQEGTSPDISDFKIIEDNSIVRVDKENVPFEWKEYSYPNGDRDCGIQYYSKIDIVE